MRVYERASKKLLKDLADSNDVDLKSEVDLSTK